MQNNTPSKIIHFIIELVRTVAIVFFATFLIRTFIIQPFIVDGSSMEPNFHHNEFIMTAKAAYRIHSPGHGDVIVFRSPTNPDVFFIKRIIGLPGDTVKIENGNVELNGQTLQESYLIPNTKTYLENDTSKSLEMTLTSGEYFVLGDNRDNSYDSRSWGPLKQINIIGKFWTAFPDTVGKALSPISTRVPSQ